MRTGGKMNGMAEEAIRCAVSIPHRTPTLRARRHPSISGLPSKNEIDSPDV
jgi:hypothetical protein